MAMSRPVKSEDLALALECPVCHDHYNSPKILSCGHTLCLSPCLEQIADGKPRLRCPECRTEHDVPEGGVEYFPTNIFVARLFDTPKKAEHVLGCPICGEIEDRIKCLHCGLFLCEECKHSHNVKFRDQQMELLRSLKDETIPDAKASIVKETHESEMAVQLKVDNAIKVIKNMQSKAHEIIDDKIKGLINEVEEFGKVESDNISKSSEKSEMMLQESLEFCDVEMKSLKQKVPSQAKMPKLMSTINEKQQLVRQTNHNLQRVVRDINIMTDLRPLKEAARSLAQVVVSQVQDTTEQQEACGETNMEEADIDKMNVATMTEDQPPTRPGSVLDRDTSTVRLSIGSEGSGDTNLKNPYRMAVDPLTKDIIIVDENNHRIQVFDKDGQPKVRFGSKGNKQDQFNAPEGVALTLEGHIIVTDYYNNRVKIHTKDGAFVRMFGHEGSGAGEFNRPKGVAVDQNGHIHVCDFINKRVQVFTDSGEYKYQYTTWKSVCDESPYGISINRNGNIAVTLDTIIAVFNKQHQLLSTFKENVWDVCWIDADHLLVPDHNNHVLKVYTVSGELVKQFGEPGYCEGQLQRPRGVTVDEDGFVYVVSRDNHMVQKL